MSAMRELKPHAAVTRPHLLALGLSDRLDEVKELAREVCARHGSRVRGQGSHAAEEEASESGDALASRAPVHSEERKRGRV